ncbi:ABC-type transporter ATP-binding protein EcsA [Desulfosporosinus acididurans]|uniref:ABC-type transporter ATP-binding protein EcsA n=1 Tax=Desulfosporosinus acididurans TaxID=476652 RepID=A0A0J1FNF5_9FIRM|nr:ABC transporter ATP-binding protein [Desulfosporosinus acididurans]KLU64488.1 ABC-type transporter ATP-binding protein EcsA [Desulfosporosinus acididurans]
MDIVKVNIKTAGYMANKPIIKNVALNIGYGELIGLIGPNGAGKSTIIKAIMGLLPENDSIVEFGGSYKNYSYIPEQPVLYEGLTLWEHLEFAASVYEIDQLEFLNKTEGLLKLFRLTHVRHNMPTTFSKGMQQKVMLILGFLLSPSLYIIDEPFIGLDPIGIKDFLSLIQQARNQGTGVLMSTHSLDTAEKICTSFVLINDGTILAKGNLQEIREQSQLINGSLFDCFIELLEKTL